MFPNVDADRLVKLFEESGNDFELMIHNLLEEGEESESGEGVSAPELQGALKGLEESESDSRYEQMNSGLVNLYDGRQMGRNFNKIVEFPNKF